MQTFPTVKRNLGSYIDAGFPIIYIHTFEESKTDRYISLAAGRKKIIEWNGANGYVDFKTQYPFIAGHPLEATLTLLKNGKELDRKLLVVKDAERYLETREGVRDPESDKIISMLKEIARKIRGEEIDATVIIVSSVIHIPQSLEKLITVLELDLPDEKEIEDIIDKFVKDYDIPTVYQGLRSDMSTAFKGLSEFEIEDLLRLAVSQDGQLTQKALQLIFDQKRQMILKAGILGKR